MRSLTRRLPGEHLARPAIRQVLDLLDLAARDRGEVRALRKELPDKPVGVLTRAALPGVARVREVDLGLCLVREQPVCSHFLPPIVG